MCLHPRRADASGAKPGSPPLQLWHATPVSSSAGRPTATSTCFALIRGRVQTMTRGRSGLESVCRSAGHYLTGNPSARGDGERTASPTHAASQARRSGSADSVARKSPRALSERAARRAAGVRPRIAAPPVQTCRAHPSSPSRPEALNSRCLQISTMMFHCYSLVYLGLFAIGHSGQIHQSLWV